MPIDTDAPSGIGAQNGWPMYPTGCKPTKMAAVETNDGDTSVIYGVSGGPLVRQLFSFPDMTGVADPVNALSVTAIVRMYATGTGARLCKIEVNSTAGATDFGPTLFANRYAGYQTCAQSSADKAVATCNAEHGIQMSATGGMELWCTQLYRSVDYTPLPGISGGFAFMIGSLAGAFIGSNLLLREMPRLARAISRVWRGGRNVRLRPDEYEAAWREWRAFRHPVYGVR